MPPTHFPQSSVSLENQRNQKQYSLGGWNEGGTGSLSPVTTSGFFHPNSRSCPLSRQLYMENLPHCTFQNSFEGDGSAVEGPWELHRALTMLLTVIPMLPLVYQCYH